MKRTRSISRSLFSLSLLLAGTFLSCNNSQVVEPPKPYGVQPSKVQIEWQKMEYYMFIHFGPNTFTDVEWGNGKEDPKVFNPSDVDCRQWAATAKAAGMKAIMLTAKHHDGFCLWPSQYSTHTVRESLWKDGEGDILKELSEACKEYGLKFGVYLSPWDQNHPAYGSSEYNQIFVNTLGEVLGNYGEIFEQWFDGANGEANHGGKKQVYDWDMFHEAVYKDQPNAVIFSDVGPGCRWMGNERGVAGATNWSRLNITGFEPGVGAPPSDTLNIGKIHGEAWVPAETDVSIRPGWFYSPSTNDKVKTVDNLLDVYYTSVGRNSNLLLNVPPDRRGRIHPNDSTRLMEFKRAIDQIFSEDLTAGAKITSSLVRGNSDIYRAENLLDDDYDSYWATNDNDLTASIEINLENEKTFNRIVLQEYIPLGQRVSKFNVEALVYNKWQEIASGTTIGYKRILRFSSVSAQKIRVNILNSLACPLLSKIALFSATEALSTPSITRDKQGMVSIVCTTPDPVIYYTTDGSDPTSASNTYSEKIPFAKGGIVKAFAAISKGAKKSEIIAITFDIAPSKWTIIDSKTIKADHMIDGNNNSSTAVSKNEAVTIDLGEKLLLKGFTYMPVTNEKANNIYKYNFYVSDDSIAWTNIIENGTFNNIKNNPIKQEVLFEKPVSGQFIKIECLQSVNKNNDYSVAEIGVITK